MGLLFQNQHAVLLLDAVLAVLAEVRLRGALLRGSVSTALRMALTLKTAPRLTEDFASAEKTPPPFEQRSGWSTALLTA